jgi:hypothetical protein
LFGIRRARSSRLATKSAALPQEFCVGSGRSKALRRKHLRRSFHAANGRIAKNPRRAS